MQKLLRLVSYYKWTASYIITIFFINSLFMWLPTVKVFETMLAPADIAVGMIYVVRDLAQREIEHYIVLAMFIAGILCYWFADPRVAVASVTAFFVGETIDWLFFTFTGKPLSQRIFQSSMISAPIDTAVFLYMIHMLNWGDGIVITCSKFLGVSVLWGMWRYKNGVEGRVNPPLYSMNQG